MRTPLPLFVVSALLFVFGVGFVVVGARSVRAASRAPAATATTHPAPIATTRQIMSGIVSPTSNAIFQSVQTNVTLKGIEEVFPRTDEEWAALGAQAASLAEAGNLLMADGRAVDRADWVKMSQAMIEAARQTMKAVDQRKPDAVLASGEAVNTSCDNCHQRYRRE